GWGLRQHAKNIGGSGLELQHPGFDFRVGCFGLFKCLYPRDQKWVVRQVFLDSETLLALADQMVLPVGSRHIAQDACKRSDTLQDDADLAARASGSLCGLDRAFAPDANWRNHLWKHHQVAHWNEDQRVLGDVKFCCFDGSRLRIVLLISCD